MKTFINTTLYFTLLFSFSSICLADVAVIVNKSNASAVSDSDIPRMFLGKLKKFTSGDKAVAVNLKVGSSTRDEFETKVLGKSSGQIKAYWSKRVFSVNWLMISADCSGSK